MVFDVNSIQVQEPCLVGLITKMDTWIRERRVISKISGQFFVLKKNFPSWIKLRRLFVNESSTFLKPDN